MCNQSDTSIVVGWTHEGLLWVNTHFRHRGREWHLLSPNWIKCRRCEVDETASRRAWHLQFCHVVQNDGLRDVTSCENDLSVRVYTAANLWMERIDIFPFHCVTAEETRKLSTRDVRIYLCIIYWLRLYVRRKYINLFHAFTSFSMAA